MAVNQSDALDTIAGILNAPGRWTPETLEAIAETMRAAGYTIEDETPDED